MEERPLSDWKVYLRWHVLAGAAPFLHAAAEDESFAFYGTVLRGQPLQEPRWQRAAKVIDAQIGEALGQLFVEKYFPPNARARYDWHQSTAQVQSRCEHFGLHDGIGGADAMEIYTSMRINDIERTLGPDCGAGWQIYWRQSVPGLGNKTAAWLGRWAPGIADRLMRRLLLERLVSPGA